jgi:4-amino-4-deoxy-L-arabinose transferase-like glycosyltransferase
MKKNIVITTVSMVAIFFIIQLVDLNADYDSMNWTIQHDEKLMAPDARAFYMGGDQSINDYNYPFSAMFGIAGPKLHELGFRIFGLNNYGLRFFYILLAAIGTLLLCLAIVQLVPSWAGVALVIFQLFNYKYFILTRYAILENILCAFLFLILFLHIAYKTYLLKRIIALSFAAGAAVIIKPLFPFYIFTLILAIIVTEKIYDNHKIIKIIRACLSFAAGLILFGGVQLIILAIIGISNQYFSNILRAFYQVSGQELFVRQVGSNWTYPPTGLKMVLPVFYEHITSWYVEDKEYIVNVGFDVNRISVDSINISIICTIIISALLAFLIIRKRASKPTMAMGLFLLGNIIFAAYTHFYIKRALPFMPITFLFLISLIRDWLHGIGTVKLRVAIGTLVIGSVVFLLCARIMGQYYFLADLADPLRSFNNAQNARELDAIVPEGQRVYMHCYAFRFLWQSHRRLISGDDIIVTNQVILDKAVGEHGKYIVLTDRGDPFGINKGFQLKRLKDFSTNCADSGVEELMELYEIQYL